MPPPVGPPDVSLKVPFGLDHGVKVGPVTLTKVGYSGGVFSVGGKFMPAPDSNASTGACSQSFSMAMAACLSTMDDGGANVSCGPAGNGPGGTSPIGMPDPDRAQSIQCGCNNKNAGGKTPSGGGSGSGGNGPVGGKGGKKVCPAVCMVANNQGAESPGSMCTDCSSAPPGGGAGKDATFLGFCAKNGNDPRLVSLCGMIDPAPFAAMKMGTKATTKNGSKAGAASSAEQKKTGGSYPAGGDSSHP